MGRITPDEVRQTALLARLELGDGEVEQMTRELDAILGYMELLGRLDVSDVPPTTHAVPLELAEATLRADLVDALEPQLSVDDALSDAPRRRDALFEVAKIVEVAE
jgi:aspartyl-tRNA(Asn)/glutamyl-tRNA(Gln) amidotransferase subunit C